MKKYNMFYKLIAPCSNSQYLINLRNVTHINIFSKNLNIKLKNHTGGGFLTYFNVDPYEINFYYDTEEDCLKEFNNIYESVKKYN
jgi:hypothetical protein